MRESNRVNLLFYCQHSLGIGHLTRSLALASALARHFRVVFLNGGPLPPGVIMPAEIVRIDLPPLGMDDGHTVVSRDARFDLTAARAERRRIIDAALARERPQVLLVELFPFGRKKFAGEILPMIRTVRRMAAGSARVVCSLRDILVDARPDQQYHDDRARWLAERYFDAVVVHADPAFARLEDSFKPTRALRTPVYHSGFVVPQRSTEAAADAGSPPRGPHVLVSAGGGSVGAALFAAALEARALLREPVPMRIIAGPFLPQAEWLTLLRCAAAQQGVEIVRHVGDMVAEMRRARASISQCGYNTAMDIAVSGVPALVVPYATAGENEQSARAEKLERLGALHTLPAAALAPDTLAAAIERLLAFRPRRAPLDLDGAARSARIIASLDTPERTPEARCETT